MLSWLDGQRIEHWAGTYPAPAELPRLVKLLIRASVEPRGIRALRFPAGADVRLSGFDGELEVDGGFGNQWVPAGRSVWELSTEKDAFGKAKRDLAKRSEEVPEDARAELAYVAVSARRWAAHLRENFEATARDAGWREVRLIDATDLADWIEQTPAALALVAELILEPDVGLRTISQAWHGWSAQTDPPLDMATVLAGRDENVRQFCERVPREPGIVPIAADSAAEAYGFVLAALASIPDQTAREKWLARSVVLKDAGSASLLPLTDQRYVVLLDPAVDATAVASLRERHLVVAPVGGDRHVTPQSASAIIRLRRPWPYEFMERLANCLQEQFGPRAQSEARARTESCGGNLTVYLRRWCAGGARLPSWVDAVGKSDGRAFLAAMLAGRFDASKTADRKIVEELSGGSSWSDIERHLRRFVAGKGDAPPLQCLGSTWFLTAPLDAFLLCGHLLTEEELDRFFEVCRKVFQMPDPRLDLPAEERPWAALAHPDRLPDWSEYIRDGLARTLLLIATQGARLEAFALSDPEERVHAFARALLTLERDHRFWASLDRQLPYLVEAAPEPFIEALERTLGGRPEVFRELFTEAGDGHRAIGMLWALETLAWDPDRFPRVAEILAGMAEVDPGGSYANRPLNSLVATLRAWYPQTHADLANRFQVFDSVIERHPQVAWPLIEALLPSSVGHANPSHRPLYRMVVSEPRPTVPETVEAWWHFFRKGIALADENADRWKALLRAERRKLGPVWNEVIHGLERIAASPLSDELRLRFFEMLRDFVARRSGLPDAKWALPPEELRPFKSLRDRFAPADPLLRYEQLFRESWPEFAGFGSKERLEHLAAARVDALSEIVERHGWTSVRRLLAVAKDGSSVLVPAVKLAHDENEYFRLVEFRDAVADALLYLRQLSHIGESAFDEKWRTLALRQAECCDSALSRPERAALLAGLRLTEDVVRAADELAEGRETFWQWCRVLEADPKLVEGHIEQLAAHHKDQLGLEYYIFEHRKQLGSASILIFIDESLRRHAGGAYRGHHIEDLFEELEQRDDVDRYELLEREWAWLPALTNASRTTGRKDWQPLICREVTENPRFFVDLLCLVYRGEGEPQRELSEEERLRAERASDLLDTCQTPPGFEEGGIDEGALRGWIDRARELASERGRREVADITIGQLLAWAPEDPEDGVWPHRAVRNVIEDLASEPIERGIHVGRYNMRGVRWITPETEYRDVQQYRDWSEKLSPAEWPRTRRLLRSIAESFEHDAKRFERENEKHYRLT